MKYVSVDLETTGLDPENDQVLELAMVVEDTNNPLPLSSLPVLHLIIKHERVTGHYIAIAMNSRIFNILRGKEKLDEGCVICDLATAKLMARQFLTRHFGQDKVTIAGKNPGSFEMQFLKDWGLNLKHRAIDPAICYWKPLQDKTLPSMETCCDRAGLTREGLHTALVDAMTIVALIRNIGAELRPDQGTPDLARREPLYKQIDVTLITRFLVQDARSARMTWVARAGSEVT